MIYITGDTHRDFARIWQFCDENETTTDDVMIILGDAGINYWLDETDWELKEELAQMPLTLFMIHGNHEERPSELRNYEEQLWNGGIVYFEPEFPNQLFAKDGEIYDLDGRKTIVIGGAYSLDKYVRMRNGDPWFESEQPDERIKEYVESQLEKVGHRVDCVLSHTAPLSWEPTYAFLPGVEQSTVDKSTEEWLDSILQKLSFSEWYCGHYHVDDQMGPITLMFNEIAELE